MRRTTLVVLCLLSIAGANTLYAQNPPAGRPAGPPGAPPAAGPGEVLGTIVEATTQSPLAHASVAIRGPQGALIAGALANDKGAFHIQGLRPGTYTMRVTMLGYSPKVQELSIPAEAPRVTLGNLALSRVAVKLGEMAIVEEAATVTVEPDRNTYRAKDVAPAAQNASDVLENVPAVQVDGEGKVSLRGNENVVVQINGRPTPIRGQQLASYLKSLPANILDRVEVVPNPSAKYDPEGMAGIINIVLKQQVDLGLSGGANLSAANADRYSGSGNVAWQEGNWTTSLNLGFNSDQRDIVGGNARERYADGSAVGFTDEDVLGINEFRGTNLNGTLEYKLNERDALTSTLNAGLRRFSDLSTTARAEFDGDRALLAEFGRSRDFTMEGYTFDASGGFRRTWDQRQKHEIVTELRYTRNDDDESVTMWRLPAASEGGFPTEGEIDRTDALMQQLVAQADYTKTSASRLKIETGYKGTARFLDRDFEVRKDAEGTGDWVRSDLSNSFGFDEQVHAVYGVLSKGVRKFDLQAGLRGEYATRDFALADESYPYDYTSLYPSAAVTWNRTDAWQYKASYSRRVRRPGTQELNPFPHFFDVSNVFLGNPDLSPEYTNAFEAGITRTGRFGMLQLSPYFRRTTDKIDFNIDPDAEFQGREVTQVSFLNSATSDSWGADVNGNLRLGQKLNAFGGVNLFRMETDGGSTNSLSASGFSWMGRLNLTSQVTKATTLQGSYFYRAAMPVPGGEFAPMQMANFSVRQKIAGESSSITLRVVDPFDTQRFRVRAGDETLTQETKRRFGIRAVFLSYQYNFGRPPRIRNRPEEQQQPQGTGFPG